MLSDFFAARWRIRALRDVGRYAHANRIDVLNGARIFLMCVRDAYFSPRPH